MNGNDSACIANIAVMLAPIRSFSGQSIKCC